MYFSHSCSQTCDEVATCSAGFCYIPAMGNHCFGLAEMGNSLACSCILGIACWPRTTSSLPKNKSLWTVPVMSTWCEIEHGKRATSKEFCEGLRVLAHRWVLYFQDRSSLCFLMSCFWRFSLQVEIWDSLEWDMGLTWIGCGKYICRTKLKFWVFVFIGICGAMLGSHIKYWVALFFI